MSRSHSHPHPEALHLEGSLDLYSAESLLARLQEQLAAAEPAIDLAAVTGCDAAGVQLLLSAKTSAAAQNKVLRLISVPEPVVECCRRLGLDPIN